MLPLSRSQLQRYRVDDRRRPTGVPRLDRYSRQADRLLAWVPCWYPIPNEPVTGNSITYTAVGRRAIGGRYRGLAAEFVNTTPGNERIDVEFTPGYIPKDGPFMISAFVDIDILTSDLTICGVGDKDTTNSQHRMLFDTSGGSGGDEFQCSTFNGSLAFAYKAISETGVYHVVIYIGDNNTRTLFVNNVQGNVNTTGRILSAQIDRLTISTTPDSTPSNSWDGAIWDVRVYKALPDSGGAPTSADINLIRQIYDDPNDIILRPRLMVPGFVAAAATADINQHTFETHRALLS